MNSSKLFLTLRDWYHNPERGFEPGTQGILSTWIWDSALDHSATTAGCLFPFLWHLFVYKSFRKLREILCYYLLINKKYIVPFLIRWTVTHSYFNLLKVSLALDSSLSILFYQSFVKFSYLQVAVNVHMATARVNISGILTRLDKIIILNYLTKEDWLNYIMIT